LTVEDCLKHPWFETKSEAKLDTEKLKQFNNAETLKVCRMMDMYDEFLDKKTTCPV